MENFKIKLKEVFIPYIIVAITTIVCYTFLRWVFDIKLGLVPLKEILLNLWLPFIIPWIPITIWLRRRIRILQVKGSRDNGHFLYQFAMVGAIAIPTMICQNHIEKTSYDLIELKSIIEIKNFPLEKYFTIEDFNIKKSDCRQYVTSRTSGKNNENLNFYLYQSCPFEEYNSAWYGKEYEKHSSNRTSTKTKNLEYRSFISESKNKFDAYKFEGEIYFEKLRYSDHRDGFLKAIQSKSNKTNEWVASLDLNVREIELLGSKKEEDKKEGNPGMKPNENFDDKNYPG